MIGERRPPRSQDRFHAENMFVNARKLLTVYYPALVPTAPTEIYAGYVAGGAYARYDGRVRGKHYVRLNRREQPRTEYSKIATLLHEEVHEKHSEIIGAASFQGVDLDLLVTDEEVATLPPTELFKKIDRQFGKADNLVTLTEAIEEGLALFITLNVLEREFEARQATGANGSAKSLQSEIKLRKKDIDEMGKSRMRAFKVEAHGYAMVQRLVDQFGGDTDAMISFLFSVSLERASRILYGRRTYREVIMDPLRRLPVAI